jgi:hypothetical protein
MKLQGNNWFLEFIGYLLKLLQTCGNLSLSKNCVAETL